MPTACSSEMWTYSPVARFKWVTMRCDNVRKWNHFVLLDIPYWFRLLDSICNCTVHTQRRHSLTQYQGNYAVRYIQSHTAPATKEWRIVLSWCSNNAIWTLASTYLWNIYFANLTTFSLLFEVEMWKEIQFWIEREPLKAGAQALKRAINIFPSIQSMPSDTFLFILFDVNHIDRGTRWYLKRG